MHYCKMTLVPLKKGIVDKNILPTDQFVIEVKGEYDEVCNEVSRRGVMFDRNRKERIQIKIGEYLVVYFTKRMKHNDN
jgi:DNA phosphorothioation-dependent restriction protein DptG